MAWSEDYTRLLCIRSGGIADFTDLLIVDPSDGLVESHYPLPAIYEANYICESYGITAGAIYAQSSERIVRIGFEGDVEDSTVAVNKPVIPGYTILGESSFLVEFWDGGNTLIRRDSAFSVQVEQEDTAGTGTGDTVTNNISVSGSRNAILDGGFRIVPRGASFSSVASTQRLGPNWYYGKSGLMVHDITQDTDVPSVAIAGVLHNYSLKIDCTTVDASIASSDYAYIGHKIVGDTWVNFAQQSLVLTLCIKATKTGVYGIGITNTGKDRTFVGEITVATTDTWQQSSVTVTASPSGGTWDYTFGIGAYVWICLAGGSDFQQAAGSWLTTSGEKFTTSNQVNACDSTSNNVWITGVQLEVGSTATDFEIQELADIEQRAERFVEKSFQRTTAPASSVGTGGTATGVQVVGASTSQSVAIAGKFRTRKRTTSPTMSLYNPSAAGSEIRGVSAAADCTSTTVAECNDTGFVLSCVTPGGSAAGQRLAIHWLVTDEL
jgi:hypothetical protein